MPPHADALKMRLVGHTDLNGHGDCMHVNLKDSYAFVGHMGETRVGTSVVDVSDPRRPRVVAELETPPGTHSHKVQVVDDVLLVNYERNANLEPQATTWTGGLKGFDVSQPAEPREIAFVAMQGKGVHRMTFWQAPYAYMSGSDAGYLDQFLVIIDLSDPSRPREAGRWWLPGQHTAGGETPSWTPTEGHAGAPGSKRYALHHPLLRGDRAYCGWWDAGLVILDVSDKARPQFVSRLDFDADATGPSRATHTVFPGPEGNFCERGGRFGPHNIHEMRPGNLQDPNTIYLTYFNAGVRVVDISDATRPREVAWYVPAAPPNRSSIQFNDILVGPDG